MYIYLPRVQTSIGQINQVLHFMDPRCGTVSRLLCSTGVSQHVQVATERLLGLSIRTVMNTIPAATMAFSAIPGPSEQMSRLV